MKSVYFSLLLSISVFVHQFAAAQASTPLASQVVVEALRPLRKQTPPTMTDAAVVVQSLGGLYKTTFQGDKSIYDLAIAINELFKKEADLKNAENQIKDAETLAQKKEAAAKHALAVGSRLTGPQPRQAAIYVADARKIREQAKTMRETAKQALLERIKSVDRMAAANQSSGNTAVAVALGSALYAVLDRSLPEALTYSSLTREWVNAQKMNPITAKQIADNSSPPKTEPFNTSVEKADSIGRNAEIHKNVFSLPVSELRKQLHVFGYREGNVHYLPETSNNSTLTARNDKIGSEVAILGGEFVEALTIGLVFASVVGGDAAETIIIKSSLFTKSLCDAVSRDSGKWAVEQLIKSVDQAGAGLKKGEPLRFSKSTTTAAIGESRIEVNVIPFTPGIHPNAAAFVLIELNRLSESDQPDPHNQTFAEAIKSQSKAGKLLESISRRLFPKSATQAASVAALEELIPGIREIPSDKSCDLLLELLATRNVVKNCTHEEFMNGFRKNYQLFQKAGYGVATATRATLESISNADVATTIGRGN